MRLKSLEVQGYKSFASKVQFSFDSGITAVVGPNGSGKSNVADAIRWALGEQSYSNLRGKKTEDMIFSGSDGRARLGMAAVTLILDNHDRWLPLDFSEVTISRRAYRSGENEYYLNGSRVRLKDVAELLAKSGLSRQTYTVIGQGTVDRVLSLHADERRMLFEEAAGITFHRKKRSETLNRLEETRGNLIRLNDIVKEIEPRLKRLQKQAERAEEYSRLNTELESLLRIWYGYRWRKGQIDLHQAKSRLRESESAVAKQRDALQHIEQQIGQIRVEHTDLRTQLGGWYSENKQLYTQAETVERGLAVNEERARQYAAQRKEILAELEPLQQNLQEYDREVAEARQSLEAIDLELTEAKAAAQQAQQQMDNYQSQRQNVVTQKNAAEKQMRRLEASLTERQTHLVQFDDRRQTVQTDQATRTEEINRLTGQKQQLQEKQVQLNKQLTALDEKLTALNAKKETQQSQLRQFNQQAEQFKGQLISLEKKENSLKARFDLLEKLRTDMSGYYSGVRAVLQTDSGLSGIVGTVSQIIQVPPHLDVAIEVALGSRLQDVVARTFAQAEQAIKHLRETRSGRATFLPLDTIRTGSPTDAPQLPGVIGVAADLVSVPDDLRPVAQNTLNRTVIVEDLPTARRVFKQMQGGFQIVTLDGELMRSGGSVTGGQFKGKKGQDGTFLAREREWRELPQQLKRLGHQHQQVSGNLAEVHDQTVELKQEAQALAATEQQITQQRAERQAVVDKIRRSIEQLSDNLRWQEELQTKAQTELNQLDQRQADTRAQLDQLEQERQQAETLVQELAEQVELMSAEKLQTELSQARAAMSAVKNRRDSRQSILDNYISGRQQLVTQIETKQARVAGLATERDALLQRQLEYQQQRDTFATRLDKFTHKIGQTETRLNDLEQRQAQLEESDASVRQRLHWQEAEHNRAALEAARRQDELDNLQRQIQDDLGLVTLEMSDDQVGQPVLPIQSLVSELPSVEELPAGVDDDVKRLKVQIRRLGNINSDAPREYSELKERYDFLLNQVADLESAAADLREIVTRLDQTMHEAFIETFEKVSVEFKRYFRSLFGGGEAQLQLTEPDNIIETGVEIAARPPGKRLQSMALLSGGERSLTAQALIFSLLRISPTPFVIFDEVDAMLDEANVSRFRDALEALARDIQFIIITHNRKTIEAASTIYGISMGADSVSQAYSLKIEEWLDSRH